MVAHTLQSKLTYNPPPARQISRDYVYHKLYPTVKKKRRVQYWYSIASSRGHASRVRPAIAGPGGVDHEGMARPTEGARPTFRLSLYLCEPPAPSITTERASHCKDPT